MDKIHHIRNHYLYGAYTFCGFSLSLQEIEDFSTEDNEKVTCKRCQKAFLLWAKKKQMIKTKE